MEGYSVEWIAIIVAVVAQMALGFLWYSPRIFGKRWLTAIGKTIEDMSGKDPTPFVVVTIGAIITSVFVAAVLDWSEASGVEDGLVVGFYLGLVSLFAVAGGHFFERRGSALTWINSGYELVRMTLVGFVLGIWQ